jgi:NDP-sugar pyrophosphorylase family protein
MLEVLILAGGLAKRLQPYTDKIPKALVNVAGKPFIFHQLDNLLNQGVKKVILCVGHYGQMIEEEVRSKYKDKIEIYYSYDGESLLGTGGAVQKALNMISEEFFFVTYGDSYLLESMSEIYKAFNSKKSDALLVVYKNNNKWDESNCIFNGQKIVLYDKINRNSSMNYIDYGISIFKKINFKNYLDKKSFDLGEVMHDLSLTSKLSGFEARSRFYEIGSHIGYQELNQYLGGFSD